MFGFRQYTFVSLCSLKAVALLRLKHGTLRELQVCDAAFPGRLRNEANHHSQISDAFGVPERVRLSFKSGSEREVWGEYTGESNPIVKIDLRDWSKLASTLIEKCHWRNCALGRSRELQKLKHLKFRPPRKLRTLFSLFVQDERLISILFKDLHTLYEK